MKTQFCFRLLIAMLVSAIVIWLRLSPPHYAAGWPVGDFYWHTVGQLRGFMSGVDPYAQVFNVNVVPYPFPAMWLGWPLQSFSPVMAECAFLGFTAGLLAYALTQNGTYWRLILFLSFPFFDTIKISQFSFLMALALVFPASLAWPLVLVKPQAALAGVVIARPTKRSVAVTLALLIISLILFPLWPLEWLQASGSDKIVIPALMPFGFLIILGLAHWRQGDYRGLLALALLPKRYLYDHLAIGLLARDWRELTLYVGMSWLVAFSQNDNMTVWLYLLPLFIWLWKDHFVRARVDHKQQSFPDLFFK